jgi:hypothetical protein
MQRAEIQQWLSERLPPDLVAGPPEVRLYDDEAIIILRLPTPEDSADVGEREHRLIIRLRESSRHVRMQLARELQRALHVPVAWGMRCGSTERIFTSCTVPVMTRLNRREREVLDTLVAAGVAETRSAALAYAVRAFAAAYDEWLIEVDEVIEQVQQVRSKLRIRPVPGAPSVAEDEPEAEERD